MEENTIKRLEELSRRSHDRGIYTHSLFLTEGERTEASRLSLVQRPRFWGGYAGAERSVAIFGREEDLGYPFSEPFRLLCLFPTAPKFAEDLTHRDYLGAILSLGIKRESLGDLILFDGKAYLFAMHPAADYITSQLTKVRHTPVGIADADGLPEAAESVTEEVEIVSPSPRLDAVVAALYHLSREEAKGLVLREKVFLGGVAVSDPARLLKEGDKVSVRGKGKFSFVGEKNQTRSGKLRFVVCVYR